MKNSSLLVLLWFFSLPLFSQTVHQKIQEEKNKNKISEADALFLEALHMYAPDSLSDAYRDVSRYPEKCGFRLNAHLRSRWQDFSAAQKVLLQSFFFRPALPYSHVGLSGRFRIHYDTTGTDAVPSEDSDLSGVPDYVEAMADIFDYVYSVEVTQLGFLPPPNDLGQDGPEWDVYLQNVPNYYGWTTLEQRISQNPDVWTSYIVLNINFAKTYTKSPEAERVTAAHEFFHMIQLGYNFRDEEVYFMELSSTWMEDKVYDDINDYYQYLGIQYNKSVLGFFDRTNVPFTEEDGWHEYGLSIWLHFLEKHFYDTQIVQTIWDRFVASPAIEATDIVLRQKGNTFEEALSVFYGWNYMTGTRADTSLFYSEGDAYPEIALDASIRYQQDTTITGNIQATAARYFHFFRNDGVSFTLIPTNVNREAYATSGEFSLQLIEGESHPMYTTLGYGMLTRLVTQDEIGWKGVAVVEAPGPAASFLLFDECKHEFSGLISGIVWEDANGDGIMDNNETGRLSNVSLHLTEAGPDQIFGTSDDLAFPTRVTGDDGRYAFESLFPGLYRLQVDASTIPSGCLATTGSSPRDVVLRENENRSDVHFGYRPLNPEKLPASIPSPFVVGMHSELKIPFRSDASQKVKVMIFSSSGFKVKEEEMYCETEGVHMYTWDGRDGRGECVSGGIYVYVVTSGSRVLRKEKLAIVR